MKGFRQGQKLEDGTWEIDGLNYGRTGEAGAPFASLDFAPVIFKDAENLRQPLALNFFGANIRRNSIPKDFYSDWLEFGGVQATGNFHQPALDDPSNVNTKVITNGSALASVPGQILRAAGSRKLWTDGGTLHDQDLETGETTSTELSEDGQILTLTCQQGVSFCLVEGEIVVGADCATAQNAGFNQASFDFVVYDHGRFSCLESAGTGTPHGDYELYGYADSNPVPPPYNDGGEIEGCYRTGQLLGYGSAWNEGRVDEGCEEVEVELE